MNSPPALTRNRKSMRLSFWAPSQEVPVLLFEGILDMVLGAVGRHEKFA
jgi:hypothetical protein